MRAYKTVNDTYVEPISFTVPRRSEVFQSDIYPPAVGTKPGLSAADWLSGKNGMPAKIDLESVYEGNAPTEVASGYKPPTKTPAQVATPIKAPEPVKKEEPSPVQKAPASMADQKVSMSALASKFQDNDEADDVDDDDSSFEEIPKPVVRNAAPAKQVEPVKAASPIAQSPTAPAQISQATPKSTQPPAVEEPATIQTSSGPISAVGSTPISSSNGVENTLNQIKKMLEVQTKTITEQNEKIGQLAGEVSTLKMKVSSSGASQDQSERIRQLELELEAARS